MRIKNYLQDIIHRQLWQCTEKVKIIYRKNDSMNEIEIRMKQRKKNEIEINFKALLTSSDNHNAMQSGYPFSF